MKEYEISNPSDKCFITGEPLIVSLCVTILGNGHYPCDDLPTFFLFGGDPEKSFMEKFNIGFEENFKNPDTLDKMGDCFDSFRYASERSSMNNIGKRAEQNSKAVKARAKQLRTTNGITAPATSAVAQTTEAVAS
jgi:hypothetical protein